eukprot:scaffold39646_cov176-Amphora_coffeaeformis.AAC.1
MDTFAGSHATTETVHHGEECRPFAVGKIGRQSTPVHFPGQSIGNVEGSIFGHGTPPSCGVGQETPRQFPRINVLYFDGSYRPSVPPSFPLIDMSRNSQYIGTGLVVQLFEIRLTRRVGLMRINVIVQHVRKGGQ